MTVDGQSIKIDTLSHVFRSFVAHVADMFASRILSYTSRRSISEWSSDNKDIKDWSKSLAEE